MQPDDGRGRRRATTPHRRTRLEPLSPSHALPPWRPLPGSLALARWLLWPLHWSDWSPGPPHAKTHSGLCKSGWHLESMGSMDGYQWDKKPTEKQPSSNGRHGGQTGKVTGMDGNWYAISIPSERWMMGKKRDERRKRDPQ